MGRWADNCDYDGNGRWIGEEIIVIRMVMACRWVDELVIIIMMAMVDGN